MFKTMRTNLLVFRNGLVRLKESEYSPQCQAKQSEQTKKNKYMHRGGIH